MKIGNFDLWYNISIFINETEVEHCSRSVPKKNKASFAKIHKIVGTKKWDERMYKKAE